MICTFLSLGGGRKPTKTCVFSAFLEAFGPGGFWPGSVLMYNRLFLNPGFSTTPASLPRVWGQNCMVFSACATFVTALVKGLESDFHCVFNLSSICDRPGGQLGVRFPWCFHGSGICGSFGESELHGASVRIPMVFSTSVIFLCL